MDLAYFQTGISGVFLECEFRKFVLLGYWSHSCCAFGGYQINAAFLSIFGSIFIYQILQ